MLSVSDIIYKIGTTQDIISEDMMRYVYGMHCTAVDDEELPHVILGKTLSDEELYRLHIDDDKLIDH